MVTFLEVRWVARNGGLSTSLIENGSSLRTKPALSLYLKQTKTVRLTSNLELLFDQVICSRTYTCQMFKTDILPFHEKKKKRLILNLIAATPQDSGQCSVYNGTQL